MADIKVRQKLKEKIDRLRRKMKRKKVLGQVNIPGVSRPKQPPPVEQKKPEFRPPKKKKTVAVGPRGGKFTTSSGGKRLYERHSKSLEAVHKSLISEIISEDRFEDFFKSYKLKQEK